MKRKFVNQHAVMAVVEDLVDDLIESRNGAQLDAAWRAKRHAEIEAACDGEVPRDIGEAALVHVLRSFQRAFACMTIDDEWVDGRLSDLFAARDTPRLYMAPALASASLTR